MVSTSLRKPIISRIVTNHVLLCVAFICSGVSVTAASPDRATAKIEAMSVNKDCVILLHGLGRSARAMNKLEKSLNEVYQAVNVDYPSRKMSIEELAKVTISDALKKCQKNTQVHFVTHSLGGILVRQYLHDHKIENLGRTVMLGPPNKGSELADFLGDNLLFEFYNGPAGQQLGTGDKSLPIKLGNVDFELGVIAGNRSFNPILTQLSEGEHDGIVSVDSSKVEGMSDHIVMPVTHTFMMMDSKVIEQVKFFLSKGKFDRPAKPLDRKPENK